jgi:hypothetical protein
MKSKIIATIFVFAASLAMVCTTTAVTTVPAFAQTAPECNTSGTGQPGPNPCTTTTTTPGEQLNPGQQEQTTTTNLNTCVNTKGNPVGASGLCSGTGQTQQTVPLSSECNVVASNAHGGEGQVTGRNCPS